MPASSLAKYRICLYLEFRYFLGGILFKNIGTGLLSSYENQKTILHELGIELTETRDSQCDILQINTPWLKSLYLMRKARRSGKPVVVWAHVTVEDALQVFRFMPFIAPAFRWYLKRAYNSANYIFCPSEYTKILLINYGISPTKLVVMSNGVDTEKFVKDAKRREHFRTQYNLTKTTVGTVGLVIPRKGIDTFLALAEKYQDYQFLWVGSIYSSLLVKPLPKTLPSNVIFTNYVDDVVAAMNAIDIFIFPSYEENQGMVILEAAAVGLPIVVRDIPVYKTWLFEEQNCLKASTEEEFGKSIEEIVDNSKLHKQLVAGSLSLSKQESTTTIGEKVARIYTKLLGNRTGLS